MLIHDERQHAGDRKCRKRDNERDRRELPALLLVGGRIGDVEFEAVGDYGAAFADSGHRFGFGRRGRFLERHGV